MSGLNVAYWQMAFDKSLPNIESRIHKKLDQLEKFHSISMENLSDWQHKQMKDLEEETKETIGFLEIIKKKLESYLIESAEIADLLLQQSVENQQLRQEIEEKDTIIDNLLNKYSQTIKSILK
jgi:hypothetical protein